MKVQGACSFLCPRSQSGTLRASRGLQVSTAGASGRCQKSPEPPRRSRADFAPRTQGLGFLRRPWRSSPASPCRLQSGAGLAGRPEKAGGSWPRPGRAPARRGAEPGAAVRSRSVPGAPESGWLLRLQPRRRRRPPPKPPAPLGHFALLRTLGASLAIRRSRHWPTGGSTSPCAPHAHSRAPPSRAQRQEYGSGRDGLRVPYSASLRQVRVETEWPGHGVSDLDGAACLVLALRGDAPPPHDTQ
ncbi:hypothetical protein NN561_001134 [Cricetulus griseus]